MQTAVVTAPVAAFVGAPGPEPIGRQFLTAGKAIFTISNPNGTRYTYKIAKKDDTQRPNNPPVFFVSLLTGPQNTSDYTYLGMLDVAAGRVFTTRKSRYTDESLPVKVVAWAVRQVWAGRDLPAGYELQHAGRCGRCGRLLTTSESIAIGIGPECLGRL